MYVCVCFVCLAFYVFSANVAGVLATMSCIVHSFVRQTFLNSFHFLMNLLLYGLLLVFFCGRNAGLDGLKMMQLRANECM